MDVVCVENQDGKIYCTEFYVKFRLALIDQAAIALLGDNDVDLIQLNQRAFPDDIPVPSTSNISGSTSSSASSSSRQVPPPSSSSSSTTNDSPNNNNTNNSTTTSAKLEMEWVDVYVNSVLNKDIIAFVGNGQLVHFYNVITRKYSITPSSKILQLFGLQYGKNKIHIHHRNSNTGISFHIWLYSPQDKFIVMDIDGTITKSDVTGYMQTVFMGIYTHIHEGIVDLMNYVVDQYQYHILYLTARPNGHRKPTSDFITGLTQSSSSKKYNPESKTTMPDGPLLMNKDRVIKVLFREVVLKDTMLAKCDSLSQISRAFKKAGSQDLSPFILGIGNKNHDALAYNSAGIPKDRILIINTSSEIVIWKYAMDDIANAEALAADEAATPTSGTTKASTSPQQQQQQQEGSSRGGILGRWLTRGNSSRNNSNSVDSQSKPALTDSGYQEEEKLIGGEGVIDCREEDSVNAAPLTIDVPSDSISQDQKLLRDTETDDAIKKAAQYDSTECYAGPTTFQTYADPKLYEYIDYLAEHRIY